MIIVSQDKRKNWNYDNLENVYIPDKVIKDWCVKVSTLRGGVYVIGYYKTEERAKEVFEEIIDTYKFNRTEAVGQKQAVYYMPEK